MTKQDSINKIIIDALEEAQFLISDEYQSVQDDELRQKYDSVLDKIQKAINILKK